jgi:hypothetical protein
MDMTVESIFGQFDGQNGIMEYDAFNEALEVRTFSPLNVVARVSGPSVGSALHLTGVQITWILPRNSSPTTLTPTGGPNIVPAGRTDLTFTVTDHDGASRFLSWIAASAGRGTVGELRQNARDVRRLSELTANTGAAFGLLAVLVGLFLALSGTEDSASNVILGITIGLSGAFSGLVVFTIGRFLSLKAHETHLRSIPAITRT